MVEDYDAYFTAISRSREFDQLQRKLLGDLYPGFEVLSRLSAPELELIWRELKLPSSGLAVELGCGLGELSSALAERFPGVVLGMDNSTVAVQEASRRSTARPSTGRVRFLRGDVSALPVRDGAADAVLSVDVLHLLREPSQAITELARVLSSGGTAVLAITEKVSGTLADELVSHALHVTAHDIPEWKEVTRLTYEGWLQNADVLRRTLGAEVTENLLDEARLTLGKIDALHRSILVASKARSG